MAGNDASVRFDSKEAERNVTSYADKIGKLTSKMKEAKGEARAMGTATKSASTSISDATRRAASLETTVKNLGNAVKAAEAKFRTFSSAFKSDEMIRTAGVLKTLTTHVSQTANAIKSIKANTEPLRALFNRLGGAATTAGIGFGNLKKNLDAANPSIMRAVQYLAMLQAAMSRGGAFTVTIKGLNDTSRAADNTTRSVDRTNRSIYEMGVNAARVRNLVTYLAGAFGVTAVATAADDYKLLRSRLDIVSDGTKELTTNYNALLASANKTRTGLKENANMFTRLMIAGEQYNLTAKDALRMTENVNMALTISGATAGEAAAATQQLAQAFSSGRLQGDELRSVLENAPILARALTTELSGMGVTMANLREKAKKGEIGVRELMQAFASDKFTKELNDQFEKIPTTLGQALQVAQNNLTDYIGATDSASGATGILANAIIKLSENINGIITILAVLSVAVAARWVAAAIAGAGASTVFGTALFALQARAAGAATTMEALGLVANTTKTALLGAFGGPIGLMITGAALAVGYFASASADARARVLSLRQEVDAQNISLATMYMKNAQNAKGLNSLSIEQRNLVTAAASLTGEVNQLAEKWGLVAAQAKAASVEQARAAMMKAQNTYLGVKQEQQDLNTRADRFATFGSAIPFFVFQSAQLRKEAKSLDAAKKQAAINFLEFRRNFGETVAQPLANFRQANSPAVSKADKDKGGGKKKTGTAGESEAEKEAKRLSDALKSLAASLDDVQAKRQKFNEDADTLAKGFAAGKLSADAYKESLRKLAANEFPGLTEAMKDLQKENDKLSWGANGASENTIKFREQAQIIKDQIGVIDTIIAKDGDRQGTLVQQRNALREQLSTYGEMLQANEELAKADAERKRRQEEITKLIDEASNQLYNSLTSRVREALDLNKNMFANFFKSLWSMAKDMFASVLAAYVFGPIREGFRGILEKALGSNNSQNGKVGSQAQGAQKLTSGEISRTVAQTTVLNVISGGGKSLTIPGVGTIPTGGAANDNQNNGQQPITVTGNIKKPTFIEQVAGGYKDMFTELGRDFGKVLKPVGKALAPIAKKLGLDKITGGAVGQVVAGAQIGSATSQLAGMLGIKTSSAGGAIGGAIGSAVGGPIGAAIGGVLGGIVGGFFKKTKNASVSLSTGQYGNLEKNKASGNDDGFKKEVGALGGAFNSSLQQIANAVGGDVAGGLNLGSIGKRKKDFTFDPSGQNRTKGSGVQKFKTEEEAIEAAIKNALMKGVIKGLSATSDRVLKTFQDTDRAIALVQTMEDIKKRAAIVRDPVKGTLGDLDKTFSRVSDMFKEMGASAEDWADLQTVVRSEFDKTIESFSNNLKEFRDQLVGGGRSYLSSVDRLKFAENKFADLQAKIDDGQFVDQGLFTSTASTLQDLAREVYGSTPEFALYQQRLLDATDKLISNATSEAEKYAPIVNAITATAQAATQATQETNNYLSDIAELLRANGYKGSFYTGDSFSGANF